MSSNTGQLAAKTALVTGAARRIGATVVRTLHTEGANVVIHYGRSAEPARELCAELNNARHGSAIALSADLLDTTQHPRLVHQAIDAFGGLDLLINNASTFYPTPVGEITETAWNDLVGANFKAPLFLSQAAAPVLRESHGLIVNMVDIHAKRPLRDHPVYCSAKAALAMVTYSLALELGPDVRVNGIAPGPILWPEALLSDEAKEEIVGSTLLKRTGTPEDIARCIVYLASDADFVTGQIIAVDGGRSVGWV